MDYRQKYLLYKQKYLRLKNQITGSNLIIHIAGPQGSGKTTLGNKLMEEFKNKIYVEDLDDLWAEYTKQNSIKSYQEYIDNYINNHQDKSLIFVGLDVVFCLGPTQKELDYYNFHTKHLFYIDNLIEQTLEQRFYRQIDKLYSRKEWFFEQWQKNPDEVQDKLIRFINLNEWKDNTIECNNLYRSRNYYILNFNEIYARILELINVKT